MAERNQETETIVEDISSSTSTPQTTPLLVNAPDPEQQPPPPHRSHDPAANAKRTDPFEFGHRHLTSTDDVFEFNAWDHVLPDASHHHYCQQQYTHQRAHPVSAFDAARFNTHPSRWWDLFYKQKSATFFKDRKWLRQEFPVLDAVMQRGAGPKVVLEVGAGAGNTAFPIVRANENAQLRVHAVDFSGRAVQTMRETEGYPEWEGSGVLRVDVWDVAAPDDEEEEAGGGVGGLACLPPGVKEGSVDVVIMIFVFSALSPTQWQQAVRNIWGVLKPGGEVLFRDYGRGDLAQVRFKAGRWMEENFYVRGDGTRVYFFEKEQLVRIWGGGGGVPHDNHESPAAAERPQLEILNLDVDRRLIVNRQKRIKMYRCWIQGRFRKPQQPEILQEHPNQATDHKNG